MSLLDSTNANDLLLKMMRQTQDEFYFPDDGVEIELQQAVKLSKELKTEIAQIKTISKSEVKTLVNQYYQEQDFRKATREQIRAIEQNRTGSGISGTVSILTWNNKNHAINEKGTEEALELICMTNKVGRWLLSIKGIGPVLAAGLLAYFDVTHAKYATNFISYAGLNDNNRPWLGREKSLQIINEVLDGTKVITDDHVVTIAARTQWKYNYLLDNCYDMAKGKWSKDKLVKTCSKIPYNRSLKTHIWKVGSSFQWLCNNPSSLYGRLFNERRVLETEKNERGEYAEQAANILATKNIDKTTEAYKCYAKGMLPKAHITARAMRWTEKIFISHLFEEMYRVEYDKIPPRYYALEHLGGQHNTEIQPEIPYDYCTEEIGKLEPREKILERIFNERLENDKKLKAERKAKRDAKKAAEEEAAKQAEIDEAEEYFLDE